MKKLLFIYNANSGRANAYLHTLHKIIKPSTYSCELCKLTHDSFLEKRIWKRFRKELEVETEFLHKDEFKKQYASKFGYKFEFPIVLIEEVRGLEIFLSKEELVGLKTTEALISEIQNRLNYD